MHGGANLMALTGDISKFVATHKDHIVFGREMVALGKAQEAVMGAAMKVMGWFQGGRLPMVPLNANRMLEMMSETVVAWLLLEQGILAHDARAHAGQDHHDDAFYEGKMASAQYFARNVLPGVTHKLELLNLEDESPLGMSDAAFATV